MFKLLRYFSLTSLLTFVVISALLGVFYRRIVLSDLVALGDQFGGTFHAQPRQVCLE